MDWFPCVTGFLTGVFIVKWLLTDRKLRAEKRRVQGLHNDHEKLCRDHITLRKDRDDLADDLEWLWDGVSTIQRDFILSNYDHTPNPTDEATREYRRALKVSLFVRHRQASRNMARGMAQRFAGAEAAPFFSPSWPFSEAGLWGVALGSQEAPPIGRFL